MAEDNVQLHTMDGTPLGVGQRLKAAREAAGLSLAQMSDRTKIPARMLVLIEAGNFAALPARTYATGFTRSYARALGLDEREYVAAVRGELGMEAQAEPSTAQAFEPGDPARVPSARLAWLAAVAALAVLAAGLVLWRTWFAPAVVLPSMLPEETASAAPSPATLPPALPFPAPSESYDPLAGLTPTSAPMPAPHPLARPHARPAQPAAAAAPGVAAPAPASTTAE